jgi:ABC-type bacteriocin/lantibiotic exporter with double-glycine peptidase domain
MGPSVALVAMMWLYEPWLHTFAVGVMIIYALTRSLAYRFYRRAGEEAIVTQHRKTRIS